MNENWRAIAGYEGVYEVSDVGRVRSLPRRTVNGKNRVGKILSPGTTKSGHKFVVLCWNQTRKNALVHRLVLEAFVGPCPPNLECCHGPGGPADNRLSNIRWDTRAENMQDRVRDGKHPQASKTHCTRGHRLEDPNLIESGKARGWRQCRACHRAHRQREYHGSGDMQTMSDAHYKTIMELAK